MRTKTLLSMAIAGLLMVLVIPLATADRVKTTQSTKVMKRPGEKETVVTRVPKGRTLTVIAREGRWMKVRVNGRTGWVARSTVQSAEAREDMPRNTRRRPFVDGRSTRRGWGGEAPDDRVGADAIEDDDDEGDSDDETPAPKKHKVKAHKAKKHHVEEEADSDEDADSDDSDADSDDGDSDDEQASADCDEDDEDCEQAAPAPKERVVQVAVAKTKLRSKPSKKGKSVHKVKKGVALVVVDEQKGWMLVEDKDSGEQGWIKKSEVWEPGARKPRTIDVTARLGFERMAQVFRSDGTGALSGYNIAAASAQVSLKVDYIQTYKANYLLGADVRYDYGKSTPGIRYQTDAAAADIPYQTHDVQAAALAGYDLHNKMGAAAYARLGYHYNMFQVANVGDFTKNLAHLPSETLAGVTVGIQAEAPHINEKIGAQLVADYMVMGKRAQTKGLEDGQVSSAKAAWASLQVTYQWKPDMSLDVGYQYEYAKTEWTGAAPASMRGTNSTEAARKDTSHALLLGLVKTW
jgi:uncharacterized protein YgiM (DUF1202 family)